LTRRDARSLTLVKTTACVSRLNTAWAGAAASAPGNPATVWFHKIAGTWHSAYVDIEPGTRPSHDVVLSLATCVGYNPSSYGG
jgi:hypothetical protein